jgi:hypothetical protein
LYWFKDSLSLIGFKASQNPSTFLNQGFLGTQNVGTSIDELGEYADFERPAGSEYSRSTRRYGNQRFPRRNSETEDDWELPMDYL